MMFFKKCGILIFISLILITGCNKNQSYSLKLYENGTSEYKINDEDKIHDIDKLISNIISTSAVIDLSEFNTPKGFSYEIVKADKSLYKFSSGYMIYDEKVYIINDYAQLIENFKSLFK